MGRLAILGNMKKGTHLYSSAVSATKWLQEGPVLVEDTLTLESPLQIRINGRAYTITMRTPGHDQDLSLGLLFTEGLLSKVEEVLEYKEERLPCSEHDTASWITVSQELYQSLHFAERSIGSHSSCGVCGKTSREDLFMPQEPLSNSHILSKEILYTLPKVMLEEQKQFQNTGGCHAAAVFNLSGELLCLREDIGRHNAVDKAIGVLWREKRLEQATIGVVSSRVSYEIVAKVHRAKIPFLLAVSAPSSMAVELCHKLGITLVGFCREDRATVYTHSETIQNGL